MKTIKKDDLYENLSQFLKGKGIELKEGSYSKGIHAGCSLLADAVNLSQTGLERAKVGLEKKVDQVRQVIHEKTAPASPKKAAAPPVVTVTPAAKAKSANTPTAASRTKTTRSKGKK
jgi:hypothetical protein